jgi:DNA-binding protein HU-beta
MEKQEKTMNKGELIEKVARDCGLSKHATGQVVESILNAISEALAADDKVKLVGFGTFSVAQRAARDARSPLSGTVIHIPARKAIRFKAGTSFVEAVRSGC